MSETTLDAIHTWIDAFLASAQLCEETPHEDDEAWEMPELIELMIVHLNAIKNEETIEHD